MTPLRRSFEPLLCLLMGIALSARVIFRAGWPHNHEGLSAFEKVASLRHAWGAGEWIPTWAANAQDGYGSPYPLLYHHAFSWLSAGLSFVAGSAEGGVRMAIPLLLGFGAWGMLSFTRAILRDLPSSPKWLAWLGAWLLITAPYIWFQWLVRGAMAEFFAMALSPWFLRELLFLIRGRPRPIVMALLAVGMFHAHSMIAFFGFFFASVVLLTATFKSETRRSLFKSLRNHWSEWAGAVAVLGVGTGPFIIACMRVLPSFSVERLVQPMYRPMENVQALGNYLRHPHFQWGRQFEGVNIEVHPAILLAVLFLVPLGWRFRRRWMSAEIFALGVGFLFLVWLQTDYSALFYRFVPKAQYLQFPWRLLSFLVPLVIAFFLRWVAVLRGEHARYAGLSGATAIVVAFLTLVRPISALRLEYAHFSPSEIDQVVHDRRADYPAGEYLPVSQLDAYRSRNVDRERAKPLVAPGACHPIGSVPTAFVGRKIRIQFQNSSPCRVNIKQFPSPLLEVRLTGGREVLSSSGLGMSFELDPGPASIAIQKRSLTDLAFGRW